MRRWAWLLAAPLMVGCSQIDALQQVSGVPLSTVRIAANDVLVQKDVPIKTAPICTETESEFTCTGSTLKDEPIEVKVPNDETQVMTITVGGKQIFSGPVQDVVEQSGEAQ